MLGIKKIEVVASIFLFIRLFYYLIIDETMFKIHLHHLLYCQYDQQVHDH